MSNCLLISVPLLILVEGVVYLWLSIWGLILRECSQQVTDIGNHPFKYIMDLIYFYDRECGQPALLIPGNSNVTLLNFTLPGEPTENRTFIILVCYVIISTLWILTSIWSISISLCSAHENLKCLSFGTWFAVVIVGSVLDAVATGYNITNLVHTTSPSKTFEYLGISSTSQVTDYVRDFDEYFMAPSMVMASFSSRVVLVWLLNLSGSYHCFKIVLNSTKSPLAATTTNGTTAANRS